MGVWPQTLGVDTWDSLQEAQQATLRRPFTSTKGLWEVAETHAFGLSSQRWLPITDARGPVTATSLLGSRPGCTQWGRRRPGGPRTPRSRHHSSS